MPRCPCHAGPVSKHPFTSTLARDAPQMDYCRNRATGVWHRGQLKLLLAEMAFLQPYRGTRHRVVYAGAAPGLHIPILAEMFPEMHFVLIDPHPIAVSELELGNVVTLLVEMTDQLAEEMGNRYAGTPILFISDVRVGPPVGCAESDQGHQERVHRDMLAQMGWYQRLRPKAGLLKFRLPWDVEAETVYLGGTILFPVFGKQYTHESRLIVQGPAPSLECYDNIKYERQMAFFNRVLRPAIYTNGKCYDCTAFASVVAKYLGVQPASASVARECRRIEADLLRAIVAYRAHSDCECDFV